MASFIRKRIGVISKIIKLNIQIVTFCFVMNFLFEKHFLETGGRLVLAKLFANYSLKRLIQIINGFYLTLTHNIQLVKILDTCG